MSKQHKPYRSSRKRRTPADVAKLAQDISSTYGGADQSFSDSTGGPFSVDDDMGATVDAPLINTSRGGPITWSDLDFFWRVLIIIVVSVTTVSGYVWWLSQLSSKVDKNGLDIEEISDKTDKLIIDSTTHSVKLQRLDSQVNRLEGKVFNQVTVSSPKENISNEPQRNIETME